MDPKANLNEQVTLAAEIGVPLIDTDDTPF